MPMTEDLSAFFAVTEHATRAVLDSDGVVGIFDNAAGAMMNSGMIATDPSFVLPTAECRRVREGSTLRMVDGEHEGMRLVVREIEPDGTGVTTLRLTRVVRP